MAQLSEQLVAEWHPQKNGDLTAHDVTAGSQKKVWWRCDNGHEWEACVYSRALNGNGCPYCSGLKVSDDNRLAILRSDLVLEWHPTKNGTMTPYDISVGSNKKRWWRCDKGHEWEASVNSRALNGSGCSYCSGLKVSDDNRLAILRPDLVSEWHPTKNGTTTPNHVTVGSNRKSWWRCDKGHEWKASVKSRSRNGNGCPYCCESKGERAVLEALERLGVIYRCQFPLRYRAGGKGVLKFDFAIAIGDKRGLIEYHGLQHYKAIPLWGGQKALEKNQRRDAIKRETCRRLNLPLLEIPHWDFANVGVLVGEFVGMLSL